MKDTLRKIASSLLSNSFIWACCAPIIKLSYALQSLKTYNQRIAERGKILNILGAPVVKHGPFKGMKYPEFSRTGNNVYPKLYSSAIYPKIMGTYEQELYGLIEQICKTKNYTEILDIGSAEGYYVVGLSLRFPKAKVFAYDTFDVARYYLSQVIALNNVGDRVSVNSTCTPEILRDFKFTGKALIICDCEGYEKTLFNRDNINALKNCDILVEVHDFIDLSISDYLRNLFSATHNITSITSVDDVVMAKTYSYPETDGLDIETRRIIFQETRPGLMEWFWIEAKNGNS